MEFFLEFKPQCVISAGGPNSAHEAEEWWAPDITFKLGVPVLGVCYDMKTMAAQHGGLPKTLNLKLLEPLRELFKDEVRGINRVVYDISGKPPATIEWE